MGWESIENQECSIARALSIFGDRWTLLIIRDCFKRVTKFSEFQKSLGIPKHRLSDRLTRLVDAGILEKKLYDEARNRFEYKLTERGFELYPILMGLVQWGDKWMGNEDEPPMQFRHKTCGQLTKPMLVCDCCAHEILPHDIQALPGAPSEQNGEQKAS